MTKTCASCGNHYKNLFSIFMNGQTTYFDCFECAIFKLAPICQNCGCKIIGHGVDSEGACYCSSHCARNAVMNANAKIASTTDSNV